jgi:hypothetical protein
MPITEEEKKILKEKYGQIIKEAARKGDWPPETIAGIMSRESRCGLALLPKKPGGNPAGTGDGGHGRGLMQIDDRAHEAFIDSGKWRDPKENIIYAVEVLNQSYRYLKKKTDLQGDDLRAAAIAGYNCGAGNVLRSVDEGESWDARTTGGDYSEDVLARSEALAYLFQAVPAAGTAAVPVKDASAQFRVNIDDLNIRSKPVMRPETRIGSLTHGQLVTKIGEADDPDWWLVETLLREITIQGYVGSSYLVAPEDYQAPAPRTGIVAVHLEENLAKVARDQDAWQAYPLGEPQRPGRQGATTAQKVQELTQIIAWLDVAASARYQPNTRATFCNIYAYDFCYLAGIYLPRVWWTRNALTLLSAGEAVPVVYGETVTECSVNSLYNWLEEFGRHFGWQPMDPANLTELQQAANTGQVVVICAQNADGNKSGHIALVVPETGTNQAFRRQDGNVSNPLISQAGRNNYNYRRADPWWAGEQFRCFGFWKHA